ncbi:MAG TPA: DinB family protein [Vicinamibacterales bacterium]|nr:DinB family protein [Vicinamibacterales bacterium]
MRITALAAAALVLAAGARQGSGLASSDRQHLVAHLEMTAGWLIDEVTGLSQAQLEFRPAPDTWNILEVLEHLVVVGPIYWEDLQSAVRAGPSTRASRNTDLDILWYGIDRTNREPAVAPELPKQQLRDIKTGLAEYRKHHLRLLEYAKTTKDDLRNRFVQRQGCDAYQWALLISTHEQRHILQIREIKAHPGFPGR